MSKQALTETVSILVARQVEVEIPDPDWVRPTTTILVPDETAVPPMISAVIDDRVMMIADPDWERPLVEAEVIDMAAVPPLVTVTRAEMVREEITRPVDLPAYEPPVPEVINTMQLAVALLLAGKISAAEAEAFSGAGVIPPVIRAGFIAIMQAAGKSEAEIAVAIVVFVGAAEYHRSHPLTPAFGAALEMNEADLNALWRDAARL